MREVSELVYRPLKARWDLLRDISASLGAAGRRIQLPSLPFHHAGYRFRTLLIVLLTAAMGLTVLATSGLLALRQTNRVEEAAQQALRRQFIAGLAAAPVPVVSEPAAEGNVPAPVQFVPEQSEPAAGTPVAILRIPAIDVDKVVVEGTVENQLRRGPGHYPDTSMPGEGGTFAVAGNRLTYGGPFLKLGRLKPGDDIKVSTAEGEFVYSVTSRKVRLRSQNASLSASGGERMVLTTTAPSLRDDRRLVVTATLQYNFARGSAQMQLPSSRPGRRVRGGATRRL